MIQDVVDLYSGKSIDETTLSSTIKEHVLASEYGWSVEYMRNMKYTEFNQHFMICLLKKKFQISQQLASVGIKSIGM
jgi:hypothetical protein